MFRKSIEYERSIKLIDEYGNQTTSVQEGWMRTTSHESVLAMLEHRANRYKSRGKLKGIDDNLVTWAMDETGTMDTSIFNNNYENNE